MSKIIRMSSGENVKYVSFSYDDDFIKSFHNFLSDIGISRDKRKNLFKPHFVLVKGGGTSSDYKDTLQVVYNKDKSLFVEIFTGSSTVIVAIHFTKGGESIGAALLKHFKVEK